MMKNSTRRTASRVFAAAAIAACAGAASATWSIVICDTRTGEVAIGSATCLTNFDLQANTPVMLLGIGGATAQSFVDTNGLNRTFIRDALYAGTSPADILAGLSVFDAGHQTKQYGMATTSGLAATFSGTGAGAWKGGTTGQIGDLVYAVQGNVLWGPLVVDKAVEAIINTPGDIPAKLMASMEAARAWGGDGRCSCSNGDPDGCTTLPDTFKSAHIAYMIVGRAGDREGSNGNYRMSGLASGISVGDVDGDGRAEVVAVGTGGIGVYRSISKPGQPPIAANPVVTATAPLREVDLVDINADGKLDAVATDNANDRVAVLLGNGNGTFLAPAYYAAGDGPVGVATGDLNGDGAPDVVVTNAISDSISIYLNSGGGTLLPPTSLPAGDGPQPVQIVDIDADGDRDILVGTNITETLIIYRNNGAGVFTPDTPLQFNNYVYGLAVADLNGDSRPDIALSNNSEVFAKVLIQNTDGTFAPPVNYNAGGSVGTILFRDLDGDSLLDMIVAQRAQSRLYFFPGKGDGTFAAPSFYPIGWSPRNVLMADMDGDDDLDPVVHLTVNTLCLMQHVGDGVFNSTSGLAGGDYFLDFNIANQASGAIDPVFQCQTLFDAFRAAHVGVPDAIASVASFDRPVINADGSSVSTLVVRAKDWQGTNVALTAGQVDVDSVADPVASIGAPVANDDGTVSVPVTAASDCGTAVFEVTINGLTRPVVLMPRVALTVSGRADFDLSGFVDTDDFTEFVLAFEQGGDDADFDRSGFVDTDDFTAFVLAFQAGC